MHSLDLHWKPFLERAVKARDLGQAVGMVGLYGTGKILLAQAMQEKLEEGGSIVIRLSLKDLPQPQKSDIYVMFGKMLRKIDPLFPELKGDSDFSFHYALKDFVTQHAPRHITFLIEEAQQLVSLDSSFFDALESLRYYHRPFVSIILIGQPQLRTEANPGLNRLLNHNLLYLGMMTYPETRDVIALQEKRLGMNFSPWVSALYQLSRGHYGTVKYLCQFIGKYHFKGKKITSHTAHEWMINDALYTNFLHLVWDSLFDDERLVIAELLQTGTLTTATQHLYAVDELVKLGVIPSKKKPSFFVPLVEKDLLRVIQQKTPAKEIMNGLTYINGKLLLYGNDAQSIFTYQERKVMEHLMGAKDLVVSYEEIGNCLWPSNADRFSLWNISQIIHRIRKKLTMHGISPKVIRSVSKKGYLYQGR